MGRGQGLADGLRKAATMAASLGMGEEALRISHRAPHGRTGIWATVNSHSDQDLLPFLFHVALSAAVKGTNVQERDILPEELVPLEKGMRKSLAGNEFRKKLRERLRMEVKNEGDRGDSERRLRDGFQRDTDRFLDQRLVPLLELTRALASLLGAPVGQADESFRELVRVWARVRTKREGFYYELQFNTLFQQLGTRMATFALWARSDLRAVSIRLLLKHVHQQNYVAPSTLIDVIAAVAGRPRLDVIAAEQAVHAARLIDREDDVSTRSRRFAELARAILPVSTKEAADYFRAALDQLDAIGSGDYGFTTELLNVASSIKGDELSEKGFHTLTNICELNMAYEAEKFPWGVFGTAMSKTSGPRGLAKLSRWHDRGTVHLEYTLLPYLTALVRDGQIAPEDALALNRLADAAELWACNTETFATVVHEKRFANATNLITEVIRQYQENNPGLPSERTVEKLAAIAGELLGKQHGTTKYLLGAHRRVANRSHDLNELHNYQPSSSAGGGRLSNDAEQKVRRARQIAGATDPLDDESFRNAFNQLRDRTPSRELEREFFRKLRARVRLAERMDYIELVARHEALASYAKYTELAECKKVWAGSSTGLDSLYRSLATPILDVHAEDFFSFGGLSTYQLREVSDLTGVSAPELVRKLVQIVSRSDWAVPASAWLGLAAIICGEADEGQGQKALEKLFNSSPAKLTSTVVDGPWKPGLYPASEMSTIAAGLVWQMLGSPVATNRWRAAHSVRCFARLGRWEVIDALARKLPSEDSNAFGAPELRFYYLHARLWLLMALARIAREFPREVAKHQDALVKIALDRRHPHVMIRHFAGQAVLACDGAGVASLSEKQRERLRTVNDSPFPNRSDSEGRYRYGDFYTGRPDDAPRQEERFRLDYDFDKYEVHALAGVFAQPGWAVGDLITQEVHRLDRSVSSMYDNAGRSMRYQRGGGELTSSVDVYGQYLAWHALSFVAAGLLARYPVTENWEHEERWTEWLSDKLLTRNDGLWLSDGMDRPPLRVKVNVLERGKEGLALSGDQNKLMDLVGIDGRMVGRDLVVEGDWESPDGIDVHISSALVHGRRGRRLAKELLDEDDAFHVWLPTLSYDDEEVERSRIDKREYEPWIVCPPSECNGLDRYDPLSVISAERRPRFVASVNEHYALRPGGVIPFNELGACPHGEL